MTATGTESDNRTVVVSGVPSVLPSSRMADKLTIHFQSSRRSNGGDVEDVTYPTNMDGVAFVTFDKAEDAEKVVKKEQHVMKDEEFPVDYELTVFPFSTDVFLYVSSTIVDLSVFGNDQASLSKSLQSTHRSIRFQFLPDQRKALIEGPLSAVKALREDLIHRTKHFQPLTQTAAVKPKVTSSHPSVKSRNEAVGSVGFSIPKAKDQHPSVNSFLKSQQIPGEAEEVQTLSSKPETPKSQKVSSESFRQVIGGESNTVIGALSGLELNSTEGKSAKWQKEDSFSPKHNSLERISVSKTRGAYHLDSKEGSSFSVSSLRDTEVIWVDFYAFQYMEKFHRRELDLIGVNLSVQRVEDLVRISLTEKKPSKYLREALETLKILIAHVTDMVRVHDILYDKAMLISRQKLTSICDEANLLYSNVIYRFEDSCIKVIGPPVSSHPFCRMVEEKMAKLKDLNVQTKESRSWM